MNEKRLWKKRYMPEDDKDYPGWLKVALGKFRQSIGRNPLWIEVNKDFYADKLPKEIDGVEVRFLEDKTLHKYFDLVIGEEKPDERF